MAAESTSTRDSASEGIKHVPQEAALRKSIRTIAAECAASIDRGLAPSREDLQRFAEAVLARLGVSRQFLGFAMVAVSNEFWRPTFEAIPTSRRLFLLPHCLSDRTVCRGVYDSIGLHCAACGSCDIAALKDEAERLGYTVVVAEGTSSVLMKILDGEADAILGVACLDSLEKSFEQVAELGVPHMALPLLRDGCRNTEAEVDEIRRLIQAMNAERVASPRSYIPLLRETTRVFQQPLLGGLLFPCEPAVAEPSSPDPRLATTAQIALDWLHEGGKRLRPFVTIAAYAVASHGAVVLEADDDASERIPASVRRIALAIESMHKASLVHDDVEDDDAFRYGQPTLHQVHGVPQAINVGDYLIGLGYRLIASETASLGASCVADILNHLSLAHIELCRGQGCELAWQRQPHGRQKPLDVLTMYAQKTAPAFEAALYAGLRAASVPIDMNALHRFATFLGEAFQIRNDLDDWREDNDGKRERGGDALANRPTILRAFAGETAFGDALQELPYQHGLLPPEHYLNRVRNIYEQAGAFDKAKQLLGKLRTRALEVAGEFPTADLQELMRFLVRVVLPRPIDREDSAQ